MFQLWLSKKKIFLRLWPKPESGKPELHPKESCFVGGDKVLYAKSHRLEG